MNSYAGLPVTIMGLGSFGGGVAAARFLAERGAVVTITDLRTQDELAEPIQQLADVPIDRYAFGAHPEDVFTDCRMLVVNPAVKPDDPRVRQAAQCGVDVTSEIDLFLRHNRGAVIAVSGSNGKSTTAALIHHLLNDSAPNRCWLGGNIGISLLPHVEQITSEDLVVLELSSFQLDFLRTRKFRPNIAVLTNFSPNHLDWHGSIDAYRIAKQAIFNGQNSDDIAIVPQDEESSGSLSTSFTAARAATTVSWRTRGQKLVFGTIDDGSDGAFLEDSQLALRSARGVFEECVRLVQPAQLPGRHNALNIAAAACAAWQAGAEPARFAAAIRSFAPLPHRLQKVADSAGRQFWNDSIATTPESAMMALQVFSGNVVLLAGGYDKGQDLGPFADEIRARVRAVVLMGQTGSTLRDLVSSGGMRRQPQIVVAKDFREAFAQAVALSHEGDIVLLSPGCASYGWFRDYRDRGEQFVALAKSWNST